MHISYRDPVVRDYCYSLEPDLSNTPFTTEEIVNIRAHIADLRSAPVLSDAPVDFEIRRNGTSSDLLILQLQQIMIVCSIITTLPNPKPNQIRRVQILEIIRTDLQLPNFKNKIV